MLCNVADHVQKHKKHAAQALSFSPPSSSLYVFFFLFQSPILSTYQITLTYVVRGQNQPDARVCSHSTDSLWIFPTKMQTQRIFW